MNNGDLISRQSVLNACEQSINILEAVDRIMDLPSVKQEPKTGHWIYFKAVNTSEIVWSECSECKDGERRCAKRMKYCPNCGARMVEPQESEG